MTHQGYFHPMDPGTKHCKKQSRDIFEQFLWLLNDALYNQFALFEATNDREKTTFLFEEYS